jgi:hypothetical protein
MWGFTVDDALIGVRYARHLAAGLGWRFNAHGPATDGVTALPWPVVLAAFARADPLVVLFRAKLLGSLVWCLTGASLGGAVGSLEDAPRWARAAVLATIALSVPLAAHAVTGMETPFATALATGAVLLRHRPLLAAGVAGLAASLRPEMAPWACTLAFGLALAESRSLLRAVAASGIALAPFVACALVRLAVWGRPAPLAVLAKPSDLAHGVAYAGAACVVTLVPLLVVAPWALRKSPDALAVVVAFLAHVGAVVVVGGDWMPYARLLVPVVPSLAWAAAAVAVRASAAWTGVRSVTALSVGGALLVGVGAPGRHVGTERAALIFATRPLLVDARRVAGLDVGWLGAATDADVVDLAGLTDPAIAALPGGHTSKRIDARFLLGRHPDVFLLYAPRGLPGADLARWREVEWERIVEARLAGDEDVAVRFVPEAWLPLGSRKGGYILLRAVP